MYGVKEHREPFRYYVAGNANGEGLVMGSDTAAARMSREDAIKTARDLRRYGWDVAAFGWT